MKNFHGFRNKVAVITGAGNGIGRDLAQQMASYGTRLALADINQDGLEKTVASLENPSQVTTYVVDVSDLTAYQQFVKQVVSDHSQVDIVINNAAIIHLHSIEDGDYEDYKKTMDINFYGVLYGCKEFLPYLKKSPEAWIANINSADGLIGLRNYSSYASSKFAVRGFTDSLRVELRDTNINVSSVHPAGVKTNISNTVVASDNAKDSVKKMKRAMEAMTSEEAAKVIIKGMARKQKRILVGIDAQILDKLVRLFPVSMDGFYARFT